MGFKDLLSKLMGEENDDLFDSVEEEEENTSYTSYSSREQSSKYRDYDDEEDYREARRPARTQRRAHPAVEDDPNKVVNIHTTAKLQVVLAKPERFDDSKEIADHLNEKRTVVLNLEGVNKDVARRIIDILNGVAYANGGQLKRVANNTFIITPYNVDVTGDLIDELENTGVFF